MVEDGKIVPGCLVVVSSVNHVVTYAPDRPEPQSAGTLPQGTLLREWASLVGAKRPSRLQLAYCAWRAACRSRARGTASHITPLVARTVPSCEYDRRRSGDVSASLSSVYGRSGGTKTAYCRQPTRPRRPSFIARFSRGEQRTLSILGGMALAEICSSACGSFCRPPPDTGLCSRSATDFLIHTGLALPSRLPVRRSLTKVREWTLTTSSRCAASTAWSPSAPARSKTAISAAAVPSAKPVSCSRSAPTAPTSVLFAKA